MKIQNTKIKPSKKLEKIIDFNYLWEYTYLINSDTAILWWWHGFNYDSKTLKMWEGGSWGAYVSLVEVNPNDNTFKFWGETWMPIANENASENMGVNGIDNALKIKKFFQKEEPVVEGKINDKNMVKVFYTLV